MEADTAPAAGTRRAWAGQSGAMSNISKLKVQAALLFRFGQNWLGIGIHLLLQTSISAVSSRIQRPLPSSRVFLRNTLLGRTDWHAAQANRNSKHLQRPEQPPRLAPALGPPQQALGESLSAQGLPLSSSSRQPVARARQGGAWSATCSPPWGASFNVQGMSQGPPGPPPPPALARNRAPMPPMLSTACSWRKIPDLLERLCAGYPLRSAPPSWKPARDRRMPGKSGVRPLSQTPGFPLAGAAQADYLPAGRQGHRSACVVSNDCGATRDSLSCCRAPWRGHERFT